MTAKRKSKTKIMKAYTRRTVAINPKLIEEFLQDVWGNNMTIVAARTKHKISNTSAHKYMKENEAAKFYYQGFRHTDILDRENLSELDRYAKLCKDATQVVEMSIALTKNKIMAALKDEEEGKKVSLKEIKEFLDVVLPYTIEKKIPANAGKQAGRPEQTKEDKFKMFTSQMKVAK